MKKISLSALLSLVYVSVAFSQVTIAPTNLYVSDDSRFGTYMVINNSNENQEVSISFLFSYSITDDEGGRMLVDSVSGDNLKYSIADYVRAFPQNFVLTPGQRQIVRFRIAAPSDLDDGTYWTRIKTASNPQAPPAELGNSDAVTAKLGMIVEQVTGLFYKKGSVTTGINISDTRVEEQSNGTYSVYADYERTGNSPFLGTITTSILDSSGQEVKQNFLSTTIYFDGVYRQDLDLSDLPAGNYSAKVTFETIRNDVSASDLVQMNPATRTTSFTKR